MLQIIDNREVYVVDLKTMPELPITWTTEEEEPYALALEATIRDGLVKEPGKYAILAVVVDENNTIYEFARIIE